ncbi:MAG: hypothetical protein EWV65_21100 [Microcystis flos-aquae Ma_QC_C_20070823_S18D]|nr:MAG: hypothetical protein EWV65_21100 [Microcystis flos-aquae Ma_QC_C_20070823_S18D]
MPPLSPLSRGEGGIGTPLIKGGRGDRHPPYQGGIKGGSAPPLSRGEGGIKGGSNLKFIFNLIITNNLITGFGISYR